MPLPRFKPHHLSMDAGLSREAQQVSHFHHTEHRVPSRLRALSSVVRIIDTRRCVQARRQSDLPIATTVVGLFSHNKESRRQGGGGGFWNKSFLFNMVKEFNRDKA